MSDVVFQFSSDERDVVRGIEAIGRAQGKLRDQIADLAAASKAAGQADTQIAKQRLDALNALTGKQQELRREAEALKADLKEGKISGEDYKRSFENIGRESTELKAKLRQLGAEVKQDSDDLKAAARVNQQYETSTERVSRSIAELNRLRDKGLLSSQMHRRAVDAEKASMNTAGTAAGGLGQRMAEMAGGVLTANAAMAAGQKVVAALRREYDRLIERQQKAADASTSLASAQEQAAFNLGQDPTLSVEGLFQRVRQVSQDLGMSERDLTLAVSDALSARGDESASRAVSSVVAAAKLRRFGPEELPGLAASALDISKGTGLGLEESLGFLLQTGTQSRVTRLDFLSENIAPAILGGITLGGSREFSAAITAALSQGIVDPTGRSSRTAATALFAQLRDFNPGGDIEETFRALQGNRRLRDQFLADASFEKKALPAVEALLTGGSKISTQFQGAYASFGADPGARFRNTISTIEALPAHAVARLGQMLEGGAEQVRFADVRGAASGQIRAGLQNIEAAVGKAGLRSDFDALLRDIEGAGFQGPEAAERALLQLESGLRGRKRVGGGGFLATVGRAAGQVSVAGAGTIAANERTRPASEQELAQADVLAVLRAQLGELKSLRTALDKAKHAGNVGGRRRQNEGGQ